MRLSIRWTLIAGFLTLIWGTYLTTTTSSYLSSEEVLNRHARDIMENIADLAMEQSQNHLAHAHAAAALTRRLVSANVVGFNEQDFNSLERYFLDQLAIYPHFAGIYLGRPNGDFFYVSRNAEQPEAAFRTKIIRHRHGEPTTRLLWRDEHLGLIADIEDPEDTYDPRSRPWYKKADAQRQIVWTDPYIFYTSQKPGITIASPTTDMAGRLQGIIGVDIEIDQLSRFIADMNIGKNGRAFMINNNGDVVAFPELEKIKVSGNDPTGGYRLVKIEELDDVLSRKAFSAMNLKAGSGGRYHLKTSQFARFEHNSQYYHTMLTPFSIANWPWIIGVHLPENDYLGSLKENRRNNILLTLALSVVATLMALLLARSILRPMAALEKAAIAVKNGDLTSPAELTSRYKEIGDTGDAFACMKSAVRETQEKYIGIFENIQDVYYETALDGTILEISPSIEKIAGLKRPALIGTDVNQFYRDPKSRQRFIDTLQVRKRVSDYEIELKDSRGDPVYYSLNSFLKFDDDGNPERIIGSMRDITARKSAEAELRNYRSRLEELVLERTADLEKVNAELRGEVEQRLSTEAVLRDKEEKYRNILESIEEGYFETDLKGNFTFFNHAAAETLGIPGSELLGMNFRRFASPQTAMRLFRTFTEIYRAGSYHRTIEAEVIRKDNAKRRLIELSASLVYDTDGAPCGYRGIGRDVTDRRREEKERRRLTEHLQRTQRLEALGRLAGGIAHDFNNLLMGIQGNASLMLSVLDAADPNIENVRSIERCVQSGANLTRQLLGYARGGKYMVKPTNINDLVRKTTELFGRTRKEIRIEAAYQEDIWTVSIDRIQIEQVLVNLYLNGYQAMDKKGVLQLKTENVSLDENFVRPYKLPSGRYVKFSVQDTGAGMAPEVQAHVFEPFFTTKTMGSGTGLGLASAFGIIKNHSGIIDFVSQPMKGTTFSIYIPATDQPLNTEKETDDRIYWGSETVLIVDDERYILKACKAMLEDMGYAVLTARSGEEAIGTYRKRWEDIGLVILDMVMPGMDGRETYRHLKKIHPGVKVLVSSGYSMADIANEMLAMGCREFIQKPFDMYKMSRKIRNALGDRPS